MLLEDYVTEQKYLLSLERQYELDQINDITTKLSKVQLQKLGIALLNLRITTFPSHSEYRLRNKYTVTSAISTKLPTTHIKVGDLIKTFPEEHVGSVLKINHDSLCISLKENVNVIDHIIKVPNDVTFKRMMAALDMLKPDNPFVNSLLSLSSSILDSPFQDFHSVSHSHSTSNSSFSSISLSIQKFYNPRLNSSQKDAIISALKANPSNPYHLIHGPPGTGKTETIMEIIRQSLKENKRILTCGPSNLSIDNIALRLHELNIPFIRLGHSSIELLETFYSLESLVKDQIHDIQKEIKQIKINSSPSPSISISISTPLKNDNSRRKTGHWNRELGFLYKELKEATRKIESNILSTFPIILSTLGMAASHLLNGQTFPLVIIDEASQALDAECWCAINYCSGKVILAGDHKQLPPTVINKSFEMKENENDNQGIKKNLKEKKNLKGKEREKDKKMNKNEIKNKENENDNLTPSQNVSISSPSSLSKLSDTIFSRLCNNISNPGNIKGNISNPDNGLDNIDINISNLDINNSGNHSHDHSHDYNSNHSNGNGNNQKILEAMKLKENGNNNGNNNFYSLLNIQYRMNKDISDWSSKEMYKGLLKSDSSASDRLLCHVATWPSLQRINCKSNENNENEGNNENDSNISLLLNTAIMWIDTMGMMKEECEESNGNKMEIKKGKNNFKSMLFLDPSKCNRGEVEIAMGHAMKLIKAGIKNIAIITPYNGQVNLLSRERDDENGEMNSLLTQFSEKREEILEIGTVDSFQGREKEAIILSMVRSNNDGEIGFLEEIRRMNVAITRAKRHLCIIGDGQTLTRHSFYKRLYDYIEQRGIIIA